MNQTAFAALGGVSKDAQLNYESGSRRPDATYLEAVASHGVDVLYVLTGKHNISELSVNETDLVRRYREAPAAVRAAALAADVASRTYQQDFNGASIDRQVSRDVESPFTINVGTKRARKKRGKEPS